MSRNSCSATCGSINVPLPTDMQWFKNPRCIRWYKMSRSLELKTRREAKLQCATTNGSGPYRLSLDFLNFGVFFGAPFWIWIFRYPNWSPNPKSQSLMKSSPQRISMHFPGQRWSHWQADPSRAAGIGQGASNEGQFGVQLDPALAGSCSGGSAIQWLHCRNMLRHLSITMGTFRRIWLICMPEITRWHHQHMACSSRSWSPPSHDA